MAHPKREQWAHELAEQTGGKIVWDEINDVWDTRRRALGTGWGSHVMILQDDAIPSEGLVEAVSEAIRYSGDHPIGLFAVGPRTRIAVEMGVEVWWESDGPNWGVAGVFPMPHVPDLIAYGDRRRLAHDDPRIRLFYQDRKTTCLYTMPSLVDHRPGESLISKRAAVRQAERFGTGIGLDWSKEPVLINSLHTHPPVWIYKDGKQRTVRKNTQNWRRAIASGWKQEAPPG